MKKLFIIFCIAVYSFGFGQVDLGDNGRFQYLMDSGFFLFFTEIASLINKTGTHYFLTFDENFNQQDETAPRSGNEAIIGGSSEFVRMSRIK
jgi:hypothetical protein